MLKKILFILTFLSLIFVVSCLDEDSTTDPTSPSDEEEISEEILDAINQSEYQKEELGAPPRPTLR